MGTSCSQCRVSANKQNCISLCFLKLAGYTFFFFFLRIPFNLSFSVIHKAQINEHIFLLSFFSEICTNSSLKPSPLSAESFKNKNNSAYEPSCSQRKITIKNSGEKPLHECAKSQTEAVEPTSASITIPIQQTSQTFSNKRGLVIQQILTVFLQDLFERAAISKIQEIEYESYIKRAARHAADLTNQQLNAKKNKGQQQTLVRRQLKQISQRIKRQSFVKVKKENVLTKYIFKNKLGEGSFGSVFRVVQKSNNLEKAVKIIKKKTLKVQGAGESIFAELEILRTLDHPSIIKMFEVYEYRDFYYVVTEYCDGGQIMEVVKGQNQITQRMVAGYMRQIMNAVNYLHLKNIVHRDLKPQNIIFQYKKTVKDQFPPVKIIDFGSATIFKPGTVLTSKVGSPYYVAPEVLAGKYNNKCDIWSCGVIMYVLLAGYAPFMGKNQEEIFKNIQNNELQFQDKIWSKISLQAKDLVKLMLNKNHHKRISALQVLNHNWIKSDKNDHVIDGRIIKNIQNFQIDRLSEILQFKNRFQAIVETFLAANTLSQEDRRQLAAKFQELDKDNSGSIEYNELLDAFQSVQGVVDPDHIQNIVMTLDTNGSGKIDFTEFIVAVYDKERLMRRESLERAFNFLDKDKTKFIEIGELRQLMLGSTQVEVKNLMREFDKNQDNKISLEEFIEKICETNPKRQDSSIKS